tara:strand:- start:113 stop:361 length:249 start_codon:yes stop_codon:yes gene_type:complete
MLNQTIPTAAAISTDLFELSPKYHAAVTAHAPLFSGMTIYGQAAIYECHIQGEDAPLIVVIGGVAYEGDSYDVSDYRNLGLS